MKSEEIQKRFGEHAEILTGEIRASEGADMVISGYAAVFEQETDLHLFREQINRGAFDDVMDNDVRLLVNHEGVPLARTTNGTLTLEQDEHGLRYEAVLADTQQGRDLYKMVKRGDISQSSFAFTIAEQEWSEDRTLRSVVKVGSLLDVSAVTYPAYPQASVSARNHAQGAQIAQEIIEASAEPQVEEITEPIAEENEKRESPKFEAPKQKKNMNINDLKGQRAAYYEEFVAIEKHCDSEGRGMTEAEKERADRLYELIGEIDEKIQHKQREQEMVARMAAGFSASKGEEKEAKSIQHKFSLSRAISQAVGRGLEGVEAEWTQEGQREMRNMGLQPSGSISIPSIAFRAGSADDFQATPTGDGSGAVATDVPFSVAALREPTFLQNLGVQTIQATGNLKFPRIANPALAVEKAEVTASTAAGLELDEINMQPRRVATKTTYSKQLILQGGVAIDQLIANDIRQEMGEFIDREGFKEILGSSEVSDLSTAGTAAANVTTLNAALAINLEKKVIEAGGSLANCHYVMSPGAYALAKTLPLVSNVSPLFENGRFNGYQAHATKHIANVADADEAGSGQIVFGNFNQGLLLAYFGGIDMLVDPFSAAGNAQITLHVNRFFDVAVRQGGALAIVTDID
jgi:HK97 family phage prohead protease/HK97 family phage major capsid protein